MRLGDVDIKLPEVEVICYNEEYPTRFYIDVSYSFQDRPYRVGDLSNILPPGVLISPKHSMNDRIINVVEEENLS